MKKILLLPCAMVLTICHAFSQNIVTGRILDYDTQKPILGVQIFIEKERIKSTTNDQGVFKFSGFIDGEYLLVLSKKEYDVQKLSIHFSGQKIDLGTIFLYKSIEENSFENLILLTDDDLVEEELAGQLAGNFQSTKDVFLKTAAFDFSSTFFRIRGLDSRYAKVVLNGVEMNKFLDGRTQWSNWGGLNDVLRNQVYTHGIGPTSDTFGGALGVTSISTRPSEQFPGIRFSYASSNRSYTHRIMSTYSSGVRKNGFSYSFSGSRRAGNEGFQEGTPYDAWSFFGSIEKKLTKQQSMVFTGVLASNRRGKAAPMTQEVAEIKGIQYNEYWGFLNGKKVNSRIKHVFEPLLQLSHYWKPSDKSTIQTNIAYQFGKIGNSRIDFNGGSNPSPAYYQNLPSFHLRNNHRLRAYEQLLEFQSSGQLDWNRIYDSNLTNRQSSNSSAYVLFEDRNDDKLVSVNSLFESKINDHLIINAKLEFKALTSRNYAQVLNLFGGNPYLDITPFADTETQRQNNLMAENRLVGEGDKFKYDFDFKSKQFSSFIQAQFQYDKIDFHTAVYASSTTYQRIGYYQNGRFPDHSLGSSDPLNFFNIGLKAGATYKFTGRHLLGLNIGFISNPPTLRNSFSNSRENNLIVDNLKNEQLINVDVSYLFRHPFFTVKLAAYAINIKNTTDLSFYFADGLGGDNTAFVQEVISGIHQKNLGIEFGIETQLTSTLKLKGVMSVGQFIYANNPNLYLTSDTSNTSIFDSNFRSKTFTTNLKNYRLANGPQHAYSVGFEYRDPEYWWISSTVNLFSNSYADIAPLTRTSNFFTDSDGLPFNDYDPIVARSLLVQEQFQNYMVVNLVGGKSWRLGDQFISVFASINNLFNQRYKTGGFEQARNSNFRELRRDKALETPVFGNKYWFGRGTNYFINISFRK